MLGQASALASSVYGGSHFVRAGQVITCVFHQSNRHFWCAKLFSSYLRWWPDSIVRLIQQKKRWIVYWNFGQAHLLEIYHFYCFELLVIAWRFFPVSAVTFSILILLRLLGHQSRDELAAVERALSTSHFAPARNYTLFSLLKGLGFCPSLLLDEHLYISKHRRLILSGNSSRVSLVLRSFLLALAHVVLGKNLDKRFNGLFLISRRFTPL